MNFRWGSGDGVAEGERDRLGGEGGGDGGSASGGGRIGGGSSGVVGKMMMFACPRKGNDKGRERQRRRTRTRRRRMRRRRGRRTETTTIGIRARGTREATGLKTFPRLWIPREDVLKTRSLQQK